MILAYFNDIFMTNNVTEGRSNYSLLLFYMHDTHNSAMFNSVTFPPTFPKYYVDSVTHCKK